MASVVQPCFPGYVVNTPTAVHRKEQFVTDMAEEGGLI